ncbi:MAG: AIR synthase-related protein, partial [Nitriliruptorales bacterium]|nr:AIR synthase-related protein [Nitriliruptorales bacterium]
AVAGLGEAAEALGIPVTGGNVSFYNETRDDEGELTAIHPTPVVGVLGVLDRAEDAVPLAFQRQGDVIFVLGEPVRSGLAGSELQRFLGEPLGGTLAPVDLEAEAALGTVLAEAARAGLLRSAHDVSGGGLLTALVESAVAGDVGVDVHLDDEVPLVQSLFSESPGRVIVSATAANIPRLAELCQDAAVPITDIGTVGGQGIVIGDLALGLSEVVEAYENAVPAAVDPTAVSR